jgi:hypothetical protein
MATAPIGEDRFIPFVQSSLGGLAQLTFGGQSPLPIADHPSTFGVLNRRCDIRGPHDGDCTDWRGSLHSFRSGFLGGWRA